MTFIFISFISYIINFTKNIIENLNKKHNIFIVFSFLYILLNTAKCKAKKCHPVQYIPGNRLVFIHILAATRVFNTNIIIHIYNIQAG